MFTQIIAVIEAGDKAQLQKICRELTPKELSVLLLSKEIKEYFLKTLGLNDNMHKLVILPIYEGAIRKIFINSGFNNNEEIINKAVNILTKIKERINIFEEPKNEN